MDHTQQLGHTLRTCPTPNQPVMLWLVLSFAVVAGGCFQSALGFGLGLTVVPILAVADPGALPTVPLMLSLPMLLIMTLHNIEHLDVPGSGRLLLGRIPGTAIGAILLTALSAQLLGILVGLALIASVAVIVVGSSPQLTHRTQVGAGFVSGLMGTTAGIGGPPLSILYRAQPPPKMRATVGLAVLFGAALSLVAAATVGRLGIHQAILAVSLLPAALAGTWLSEIVDRRMSRETLQRAVLVLSTIAALAVIVQACMSNN